MVEELISVHNVKGRLEMKVIGLTGGIASGKSTVSSWFIKDNYPVIDADIIYKQLSKPGELLYNKIIQEFGEQILCNHQIDFLKLGRMIFENNDDRIKLNEITHPEVLKEIERLIEQYRMNGQDILILSVPLLFESHMNDLCDKVICVYVTYDIELERLISRDNIHLDYAVQKILTQMPLTEKQKLSDFVIDNSHSQDYTYTQYKEILKKL